MAKKATAVPKPDKQALMAAGIPERVTMSASARGLDFGTIMKLYAVIAEHAPELRAILGEVIALGADGVTPGDALKLLLIVHDHAPKLQAFVSDLLAIWWGKTAAPAA